MGFFDKIKSAVNSVTGGAATVTIEVSQACVFPGDEVSVRISATSTGAELKSKGVFVDLKSAEEVRIKDDQTKQEISKSKTTVEQTFQIAPAFVLAPNESKVFEGIFRLPTVVPPSYAGTYATHSCYLRGRVEAFGNDPDSGFQPVRVGTKA